MANFVLLDIFQWSSNIPWTQSVILIGFICFNIKILLNTQLQQENITAQKTKFSIKNVFSILRIWSHLVKRFLIENFIFLCSAYWNLSIENVSSLKHSITTWSDALLKIWRFNWVTILGWSQNSHTYFISMTR